MVVILPLSLIDAILVLWIMGALVNTMRALRIRNNIGKLSLYRQFTLVLAFGVVGTSTFSSALLRALSHNHFLKSYASSWVSRAYCRVMWHNGTGSVFELVVRVVSVVFTIWSMMSLRTGCVTEWKSLWIDEAFWHLLFSFLLGAIMFLWRPSQNSLRFSSCSFSPPDA